MCGIVGYTGAGLGIKNCLECLSRLEYRGYDSAGLAYFRQGEIYIDKKVGKLANLETYFKNKIINSSCCIGHTRWATHGEPNLTNAHPHCDMNKTLALVHNGIIENFSEIKQKLEQKGVIFKTNTDTEAIAQLLGYNLNKVTKSEQNSSQKNEYNAMHSTLSEKVALKVARKTFAELSGSYGVAFILNAIPETIFFIKDKSPLIIGKAKDKYLLASDIPALLPITKEFYFLKDGECGFIKENKLILVDSEGNVKKPKFSVSEFRPEQIILGEYKHFMQKEIEQGAESVIQTVERIRRCNILNKLPPKIFNKNSNLVITACGTALNAGHIARYLIENLLDIYVDIDFASEYRYKDPILNSSSICIFISQSGETADTLSCLELAKSRGATTIAVTNVPSSRLELAADYIIPTSAGPEVAVASTKAYLAQLGALYALIERIAEVKGIKIPFDSDEILLLMKRNANRKYKDIENLALEIKDKQSIFFIGRGLDYFLAVESALKLKEITYIHCEALAAGELKHGSLALISKDSIVIAILTQKHLIDKTLNSIYELNARGAKVVLFTKFKELEKFVYKLILIPESIDALAPFVAIKPLQLLAYYTSVTKGNDPDKPRNLAKSVTVE